MAFILAWLVAGVAAWTANAEENEGAATSARPDPAAARPLRRGVQVTEEERAYWAFQPPRSPPPPRVKCASWGTNPIDPFILARLEEKGIEPNPQASPRELVRRAYFDLTGLPPPPGDVVVFAENPSPEAWGKLIDRLLARPEYGERWGRHWLDLVRFGESNGYERDDEKPLSWRYRDYVIKAFNEDKPYDRFILEQLAGDELDDATADSVAATGFYRLGVWDDEPDDARMAEYDYLDDIVRVTGGAFLGLTVGCARCHDHKFDPLAQEDYYGLLAFFRNVRNHENPKFELGSATFAPLAPPREVAKWQAEGNRKAKDLEARISVCTQASEKARLEEDLKTLKAQPPPFEWTLAVSEQGPMPKKTQLLIRGSAATPGKDVEPAFLEVLGGRRPAPPARPPGSSTTGLRRTLAEWIASPGHPLTARVMVNRLWQHHFGRGIVESTGDFGKAGIPPTHPELLDWLAARFVEDGWSLKRLQKLVLSSSAYQMSSSTRNAAALAADEGNRLFWRQGLRRLEAEAIRDAILEVSGSLNRKMGGRGIFPRLSREVIASGSRPGLGWDVSTEEDRRRRSVYIFVKRSMLVPFLEGFDYANTAQPLEVRPITTVAPQALMLLNSDLMDEESAAFASRLLREAGDDQRGQVERAYLLAAGRGPTEEERRIALDYLKRQEAAFAALPPSLMFTPRLPSSVSSDYLRRLKPEDFLSGPRKGWTYHRGRWGSGYEGIEAVEARRGPFALWEGRGESDQGTSANAGVEIEGRIRLNAASEGGGVIFRAGADGEALAGYEVALDSRVGRLSLLRHDAKEARELAATTVRIVVDRWHRVKVEAAGPRIRVWLDGAVDPLIDRSDPDPLPASGRVGLKTWGSPLSVEDLVIRSGEKLWNVVDLSLGRESSPRRKALESFCRVVLNLSELVYID